MLADKLSFLRFPIAMALLYKLASAVACQNPLGCQIRFDKKSPEEWRFFCGTMATPGINEVSQVEEDKPPVLTQLPSQPPMLTRVTSTQAEEQDRNWTGQKAFSCCFDKASYKTFNTLKFKNWIVQRYSN